MKVLYKFKLSCEQSRTEIFHPKLHNIAHTAQTNLKYMEFRKVLHNWIYSIFPSEQRLPIRR